MCGKHSILSKDSKTKALRNDIKLVAVLPQKVDEAQRYFKEHEISVDEVKQLTLSDIYVKGTPTLIMVDKNGLVIKSWVGKLSLEKENEVFSSLWGKDSEAN